MVFFTPINEEFKVNNSTSNAITNPDVGVADNGNFVIVWQEAFNNNPNDIDIKFRRFSANGEPLDMDDRTIVGSTENEINPRIAVGLDGRFVVTYIKNEDIFVKRFDADGSQLGDEILVSTFDQNKPQFNPKISIDKNGNFGVVWTHEFNVDDLDIRGRFFNSDGNPITDDLSIATSTLNQSEADIALVVGANNSSVAAVVSYTVEENGNTDIFVARLNSSGTIIDTPINVVSPDNRQNNQRESSIAIDSNGNFVISWTHEFDSNDDDIHLRRFSANGNPLDNTEIIVDTSTGDQDESKVALNQDGSIVVVYEDDRDDSIKYRQFDNQGVSRSSSLNYDVNSSFEDNPAIAIGGNNTMVITADDDNTSAFNPSARVFSTPLDSLRNRFQNTNRPGTYLFADEIESQSIRQNFPNFTEEGLAFNVASAPGDDLIRINRFQNSAVPGTYLFADDIESQSIRQNFTNFIEEGIAFYVYGADANKGADYYRFQNTQQLGTYIFVGEEEKNNIMANFPQFVLEGVAFEVVV